jgi:hypothetical protein
MFDLGLAMGDPQKSPRNTPCGRGVNWEKV